jgi:uncharacterized protein YqjF (DUF2071 family)
MLTAPAATPKTSVFMTASWRHLAMLNFPIDGRVLEPFLPAGTELDTWRDQAYVSMVGFEFLDARLLGWSIPLHRHFVEVNLRFYVRRQMRDGWRRGVVFIREIAPRALVCVAARWFYNENYVTMPMRHHIVAPGQDREGLARYEWYLGKRWQEFSIQYEDEPRALQAGSEEEFIAEHYWAYTRQRNGSTLEYEVEHPPWRISPARSVHYDGDVEAIYGKAFAPYLCEPTSAFVADGSPVLVRRGRPLFQAPP